MAFTEEIKAKLIEDFNASGMSVPQFCKAKKIAASTFRGWLKGDKPRPKPQPQTADPTPVEDMDIPLGVMVTFVMHQDYRWPTAKAYLPVGEKGIVRLLPGREYKRPCTKEILDAESRKKIVITEVEQ